MARKILLIPILFFVLLASACGPEGDPYKDSKETGNYFFVTLDPLGGGFVITGSTIDEIPTTDVTFENETINSVDNASDVFISRYDLVFTPPPGCPVADCPPLTPILAIPIWSYVPKGGSATVDGVPMAFADTYVEFLVGSATLPMVAYKATATYFGENEFGYKVKGTTDFALFLP